MHPRILIVDDEAPARLRLRQLLSDIAPDYPHEIVGEAGNGRAALELLSNAQAGEPANEPASIVADIALLDVQMPAMTGLQLARHMNALAQPPAVIFVTAFDAYAVQAFEVHALDYLMKPVRAQRLLDALRRVAQRPEQGLLQSVAIASLARQQGAREHITVNERGRIMLVPVADVLYLKAEQKYVTLRTTEREYLIEESLVALEEEFTERFVRVHRNALVARAAIRGFQRVETILDDDATGEPHWEVVLQGLNERLLVSRRQWPVVKALVK
jgi:two-component system response regulator AlgR